jgi:hypothetical protein
MRQLIPRSFVAIVCLMSLSVALVGCTYVDATLQRRAPPDTRVKLGWQDRVFVYSRDAANYTCQSRYILTCAAGGAITLSCTCELR